jgi:hypothetical protein
MFTHIRVLGLEPWRAARGLIQVGIARRVWMAGPEQNLSTGGGAKPPLTFFQDWFPKIRDCLGPKRQDSSSIYQKVWVAPACRLGLPYHHVAGQETIRQRFARGRL